MLPEEKECEVDKETQSEADVSEDDWNAVSGVLASCTFSKCVTVDETLITTERRKLAITKMKMPKMMKEMQQKFPQLT